MRLILKVAVVAAVFQCAYPVLANKPNAVTAAAHRATHHAQFVAFDAKDNKYYSMAYAKAHGMHDKGGDRLTIVRRSSLPKDAKLSRAMNGVEP